MPMIMCAAGKHFYNPDIHGECPSCKEDGVASGDNDRSSEAVSNNPAVKTDVVHAAKTTTVGATTAKTTALNETSTAKTTVQSSAEFSAATKPPAAKESNAASGKQAEQKPEHKVESQQAAANNLKTRVVIGQKQTGTNNNEATVETPSHNTVGGEKGVAEFPVVGWLVVMSGTGSGTDFRLIQGENRIGRGEGMEICLDFGPLSDQTVSREAHAIVVYDNNANEFFIERGNSRNLPMLNGQTIRRDQNLNSGDTIQLGATELRFVAFCQGAFSW
ncbi:MAG: FHA domain-containing protein [Idiomarina sp.]|nr:FHA domain-containing protein [Idiomarina sp.]